MGLSHEIARAAGVRLIEVGALQLIAAADFLSFVAICRKRQVAIVGIEGFRLRDDTAVPEMGAIADFSEMRDDDLVSASAQEAERFFQEIQPSGMLFDFILAEKGRPS